jgi:hypothetical protein
MDRGVPCALCTHASAPARNYFLEINEIAGWPAGAFVQASRVLRYAMCSRSRFQHIFRCRARVLSEAHYSRSFYFHMFVRQFRALPANTKHKQKSALNTGFGWETRTLSACVLSTIADYTLACAIICHIIAEFIVPRAFLAILRTLKLANCKNNN